MAPQAIGKLAIRAEITALNLLLAILYGALMWLSSRLNTTAHVIPFWFWAGYVCFVILQSMHCCIAHRNELCLCFHVLSASSRHGRWRQGALSRVPGPMLNHPRHAWVHTPSSTMLVQSAYEILWLDPTASHMENVPSAKLPQMRMRSRGNGPNFSSTPIWAGYPLLGCYLYHQPIVLGSLWWRLWSIAIN